MNSRDGLHNGRFDSAFSELYPISDAGFEPYVRRYSGLIDSLVSAEGTAAEEALLFSIPGRTELGGNHTDHNLGKVLAASVHLDVAAAAFPRNDRRVLIYSEGYPDLNIDLSDLESREDEQGSTSALVRGVASWFSQNGYPVGGFSAAVHSLVPGGSGLSSSAAIEITIAKIFSVFYHQDRLSPLDLAIAGQYAENRYFGKPCGLMDQIACAHGGIVKIDFADGDAARIETRDADFLRAGYLLGIVNTGGSHADLTDDYASIPREMRSVANALGSEVLRQIDEGEFHASIPALRRDPAISDRAIMRTLHFFAENRRVDQMLVALSEGRYLDYLSLVRESGHSSMRILQNVTPCGAIDEQNLALVATYIEERFAEDSVIRVHGGGFEGSLQFYVSLDRAEGLLEELQRLCGPGSVDILYIRGPGALCLNQAPDN